MTMLRRSAVAPARALAVTVILVLALASVASEAAAATATQTTLTVTPSAVVAFQDATLQATVTTFPPGGPVPTGTVQFSEQNGGDIGGPGPPDPTRPGPPHPRRPP